MSVRTWFAAQLNAPLIQIKARFECYVDLLHLFGVAVPSFSSSLERTTRSMVVTIAQP
jgi:hypothetical protein